MSRGLTLLWLTLLALSCSCRLAAQDQPQFAALGDLRLESGEVIRDCRLGYRTFGQLNADKSNVVLFPTWFSGQSKDLAGSIGPGKLVDSSRYFVIAVDALGNGVSSSPSNSQQQPGAKFPAYSVRDMVAAEYQLITRVLGLRHLRAVVGISMGGMQTFEWAVAYPEMMDVAIPVVGTTRQTAYDLLLWQTELKAIEEARKTDSTGQSAAALIARIHALALVTPSYRNAHTTPDAFQDFIGQEERNLAQGFKADDWASQLRAMMAHDVSRQFGGSVEKAASAVKARVLVVVSREDHMVNPGPALAFARLLKAPVLEVAGDCGHIFTACENNGVNAAVASSLEHGAAR